MSGISKKEYDIYGNLILNIQINTCTYNVNSEDYINFINGNYPAYVEIIGKIAKCTYGHYTSMKYDEKNNLIEADGIYYDSKSYHRQIEKYIYTYSIDGLMLEKLWFSIGEPLRNKTKIYSDLIEVTHIVYEYDKNNNPLKELLYKYNVPSDFDFNQNKLEQKHFLSMEYYVNSYNDDNRLIKVIKKSDGHWFDYKGHPYWQDGFETVVFDEITYQDGKVKSKKLENENTAIYFYVQDSLQKEEIYGLTGVLLKTTLFETIGNRIKKILISPANDGFLWFFSEFDNKSCGVEIEEDIVTPDILTSIYEHIIHSLKAKGLNEHGGFGIFLYSPDLDINTFEKELDSIVNIYKTKYNIELIHTF